MKPPNPLVVALDRSDRDSILALADDLRDAVGMMKVGLQAFVSLGPSIVSDLVSEGHDVFLDLKLHDIPNTVSGAAREAAMRGVSMLNVHAAGGSSMMEAARHAARGVTLLAVTVLTSLSDDDLTAAGVAGGARETVPRLARLAADAGLDGVVASPHEIALIRAECGDEFVILTPGIRSSTDASGDQKRTMTAGEAIRRGADWIVVGRPITSADSPAVVAARFRDEIEAARQG